MTQTVTYLGVTYTLPDGAVVLHTESHPVLGLTRMQILGTPACQSGGQMPTAGQMTMMTSAMKTEAQKWKAGTGLIWRRGDSTTVTNH